MRSRSALRWTACLFVACRQAAPEAAPEADASVAIGALDAGDVAARADAGDAGATCIHPAYQSTTCLDPNGELEGEAVVGWFADHGAKVPEEYPGYLAQCREVAFGPEREPVLACTTAKFVPGPLFGNGPMGDHRELRLLAVRSRKAFEIVRLPLAFTEAMGWDGDTLFSARYAIDQAAGAVELIATPEECEAARVGVAKYHRDWAKTLVPQVAAGLPRDQITARLTQGKMDDAQLTKICRAAGRYVPGRGGRLVRAVP